MVRDEPFFGSCVSVQGRSRAMYVNNKKDREEGESLHGLITVSLYNYHRLSVGSRTPFTVSVIRSLPLRANPAYYIMPQPLHALGCFTAVVATYILQPVGLVGSFCERALCHKVGRGFLYAVSAPYHTASCLPSNSGVLLNRLSPCIGLTLDPMYYPTFGLSLSPGIREPSSKVIKVGPRHVCQPLATLG